jgi:hypothetical protein
MKTITCRELGGACDGKLSKLAAAFGAVFVATRLLRLALIEATFVAGRRGF